MAGYASLTIAEEASGNRFWPLLRRGFAAHAPVITIALTLLLALKISELMNSSVAETSGLELVVGILTFSVPVALLALMIFTFGQMILIDRPERPSKELYRRMKAVLTSPGRMVAGLPMFVSLLVFMYGFTMLKAKITAFVPFSWDMTFDTWDKALHFGIRPWEWLAPLFNTIPATVLLNVNYNAWFIIMNVFWVYYAFIAAPGHERSRFFIAFMLIWSVGGSLLAIIFSSAGPAYFSRIGLSPDPYAELMASLHAVHARVPVWALDTQDMLWRYMEQGSAFGGISAMPSMHNATTLLFVLVTWNAKPWLRNAMIIHAVLIYLGSIHLGWHYAVDSYLAWALVVPLWYAADRLAKWWEAMPAQQSFSNAVKAAS